MSILGWLKTIPIFLLNYERNYMHLLLFLLSLYTQSAVFAYTAPTKKVTKAIKTEQKQKDNISSKKASSKEPIKKTEAIINVPKIDRTFAIIKPDAVEAGYTGEIIKLIELNKFNIIRMKKIQLTRKQAENFYKVHKDKEFFPELIKYITSGPVVVLALEKENSIKDWRNLMGATNPEKAPVGTIRKMFGSSITRNATHGSDSPENAQIELLFFFPELQYN